MVNTVLAATSVLMTYVHLQTLMCAYPFIHIFYAFVIIRGCLTSIHNHVRTSHFDQSYDRIVMQESLIVDIAYIIRTNSARTAGLDAVIAICLYLLSKYQSSAIRRNSLHGLAHFMITIAHVKIIHELMMIV